MRPASAWLAAAVGVAAVAVVVWLHPQFTGDTFVALAGGRDVVEGKLGAPDDWSFTAPGAWFNQNWGAGLLFYGAYQALGFDGLAYLKLALLAVVAVCAGLALRRHGALVAAAAVAGVLVGARPYLDMRPNLVGLAFAAALLATLERAAVRPQRVWIACALLAVWANTHGSFLFGLGMFGLWALCRLAFARQHRPRWPLVAAPAVAIAAAAFVNPFGIANLTRSFGRGETRGAVDEWQPIFAGASFGTAVEFAVLLAVLGSIAAVAIARRVRSSKSAPATTGSERAVVVFEWALVAVPVAMTWVLARRFVPFAMLCAAPVVARGLAAAPRAFPAAGLALLLGICAWRVPDLAFHYRADNPNYRRHTLFERMIAYDQFAPRAARFLADNAIAGRALNDWWWEGYLHWFCPDVRLYVGGRAQQVYPKGLFSRSQAIFSGSVPPAAIAREGASMVILASRSQGLLVRLCLGEGSTWVPVFSDGWAWVFADSASPDGARLVARARAGELEYPDAASAAITRFAMLCSPIIGGDAADLFAAAQEAARAEPASIVYGFLFQMVALDRIDAAALLAFFAGEERRLAAIDPHRPRGMDLLYCRRLIARLGGQLAQRLGRTAEVAQWQQRSRQLEVSIAAVGVGRKEP